MTTLIKFLKARVNEDEAAIREDAGLGLAYGWLARLLAEVEAKRRIVDLCAALADPDQSFRASTIERTVLRELVQPYANHPDFDRDWLLLASTS